MLDDAAVAHGSERRVVVPWQGLLASFAEPPSPDFGEDRARLPDGPVWALGGTNVFTFAVCVQSWSEIWGGRLAP